jgi:hypothetical protein
MAKLLGLILLVLAVWVGVEVFDKGVDGAFGGLFAGFSAPLQRNESTGTPTASGVQRGSLAQRVGAKVQSDMDAGARRDGADGDDEPDND